MVVGENGILNRATDAKIKNDIAKEEEDLEFAINSSKMDDINNLRINKDTFEKELKIQFGKENFILKDNKDGSFFVEFTDKGRSYYIENNGNIINNKNFIEISTEVELKNFRNEVNNGNNYKGKYIYLKNDISLSEDWIPIGNKNETQFSGIFDGNNKKITNINIDLNGVIGFFGYIENATIKNISIHGNIKSKDYRVGGICGEVSKNGTNYFYNCKNYCNVESISNSPDTQGGGIIGNSDGEINIINCYNYGNIKSFNHTGGIIARVNNNLVLEKCYNGGEINNLGLQMCGGIIGCIKSNNKATIKETCSNGKITGNGKNFGGLIGASEKLCEVSIYNCYNKSSIDNESSTAEISCMGGILGYVDSNGQLRMFNCYNNGYVKDFRNGANRGLVGYIHESVNYEINNCYYLNDDSNNSVGYWDANMYCNVRKIPKSEVEMKENTFIDLLNTDNDESIWVEDTNKINNGYPILKWQVENY